MRRASGLLAVALALALVCGGAGAAPQVACHLTYGGQTRTLSAAPTGEPYRVEATHIGSYFLFRIVFRSEPADLASIKLYTAADLKRGPVPLHQASFPYPPVSGGDYGFTGLQRVYEPLRDSELQYWCELRASEESKK